MNELSAKNLTIRFKDGQEEHTIIDNVDITCKEGQTVILSGPSGCGKSSLLYVLAMLREPSEGEVIYNQQVVKTNRERQLMRFSNFGFIFQQHFLIPYLSIVENVRIKSNITVDEAMKLVDKVGLSEYKNKKIYQLSGGQKQRVAIARALAGNPDVIFADEPTASLDKKNAIMIYDILTRVAKDKILIMATHDKSLLNGDEIIYSFDNKKIKVN